MKYIFFLIIIFVFVAGTKQSIAQYKQIDSLKILIGTSSSDSTKIELYKKICEKCEAKDKLNYGTEGLKFTEDVEAKKTKNISRKFIVSQKLFFWEIIGLYHSDKKDWLNYLRSIDKIISLYQLSQDTMNTENYIVQKASIMREFGQTNKSFDLLISRLQLYEKQKNWSYIAYYQREIAEYYMYFNKYDKALPYIKNSLKIYEDKKYISEVVNVLDRLAEAYDFTGHKDSVLMCLYKSINLLQSIKETQPQDYSSIYWRMTSIYTDLKQNDSALTYLQKRLQLAELYKDTTKFIVVFRDYASFFRHNKDYKKAIEYGRKALDLSIKQNNEIYVMWLSAELARTYFKIKNYIEALNYFYKAEGIAKKRKDNLQLENVYKYLCDVYSEMKDYKNALQYHIKSEAIKDTIKTQYNSEEIEKKIMLADFEKSEAIKQEKQSKKDAIEVEEKKKQRIILLIVTGFLLLVALLAGLIFKNLRQTKKQKLIIEQKEKETQSQKHLVEEKHKEITDSINYAERIQRSFLATKELLDDNLKDYFIFFKPKDIVSGDFYWCAKLSNGNFALATADSTGHGVPGAIMSLLNVTSLEKAIEHYTNPADILNHTRQTIIERLKKDGSEEGGKDGMDCSLLVFNFNNRQLHIAAANNPVWIFRSNSPFEGGVRRTGDVELIEIKPDKMPVGKSDKQDQSFNTHTLELQKGDTIYTLTDGFPDQFGGPNGKKFMSKKLKELLLANVHLPIDQQKELLDSTFKNWVGDLEQVDDVTVIGIRI
jgi:serine phosphatase RsbU (regulator of sigma subunit)